MGWHMGGAGMWIVWLVGVVLAVLLILAIVRIVGRGGVAAAGPGSAEDVLRDRFARGEIDQEEYRARLDALRGR